jgi:hypothetical protein
MSRTALNHLAAVTMMAAIALLVLPAPARADATSAPLHGGVVTEVEGHVFETLIDREGLHVWFHTDELAPAMVGRAGGTASLKLPDGQVREVTLTAREPAADDRGVFFCPMHPEVVQGTPGKCEPCGGMILFHQDELLGAVDLSGIDARAVTAQVRLTGLKGRHKEATFSPAFPAPDGKAGRNDTGR